MCSAPAQRPMGKALSRREWRVGRRRATPGTPHPELFVSSADHLEDIQGLLPARSRLPHGRGVVATGRGRPPFARAFLAPWFGGPAFTPLLGHWHRSGRRKREASLQISPFPILTGLWSAAHPLRGRGEVLLAPGSRRCVVGCESRPP